MDTQKIKMCITLSAEAYGLLEELCRVENRNKSRQISWLIKQAAKSTATMPRRVERGIIYPDASVWNREAALCAIQ
jgi:hypothetical protein